MPQRLGAGDALLLERGAWGSPFFRTASDTLGATVQTPHETVAGQRTGLINGVWLHRQFVRMSNQLALFKMFPPRQTRVGGFHAQSFLPSMYLCLYFGESKVHSQGPPTCTKNDKGAWKSAMVRWHVSRQQARWGIAFPSSGPPHRGLHVAKYHQVALDLCPSVLKQNGLTLPANSPLMGPYTPNG